MKTIALTGATSPIGTELLNSLSNSYKVIPISRTTGFDLLTEVGYSAALSEIVKCDYFINLANVKTTQACLLLDVYNTWTSNNNFGKIISFGTLATEASSTLLKLINADFNMIADKLFLEKVHDELSTQTPFGDQPQSCLIRFANFGKKSDSREDEPCSTPEQLCDIVKFILSSDSYISTLDFRAIYG